MKTDNFFDYFFALLWKNKLITLIIAAGILLRVNNFDINYYHAHDQDLSAWIIRDILSGHIRLIGQQTSRLGVFIGPLFYYLLIPFYLVTNLNPLGTLYFIVIIAFLTIFSIYYTFKKVFNKNTAIIASLIYALNLSTVLTDREVVPTVVVFLWSTWFLYCIHLLLTNNTKYRYPLLGLLFGLVWHVNLALGLLAPIVILSILISKYKPKLKDIFLALLLFGIVMIPFFVFELRHGFIQTNSILNGFTSVQNEIPLADKYTNTIRLATNNVNNFVAGKHFYVRQFLITIFLTMSLVIFTAKKIVSRKLGIAMLAWLLLFVIFFTFNNIILSEYYLNGMLIVWLAIISSILALGLKNRLAKVLVFLFLITYSLYNLWSYNDYPINRSGYYDKNQLTKHIKKDAAEHGYPCIAISYITKPGNQLGYRYIFVLNEMHVNKPPSGSPVYTIVYPHSMVDRLDKSFGALGLIYPDYEKYDQKSVKISCQGQNSNEVDSLFGYTE